MRYSAFITALAALASSAAFSEVLFDKAREFPDLGLELPVLSNSRGMPLEMPRATAYLVGSGSENRLSDKFDVLDLWTAMTIRGRWKDQAGNMLWVARLSAKVPQDQPGVARTRADFRDRLERIGAKDRSARDEAVMSVSPVEVSEPEKPRRAKRRNFAELWEYPCEAPRTVVYAFLPMVEGACPPGTDWYMVSFEAGGGEDLAAALDSFDRNFLDAVAGLAPGKGKDVRKDPAGGKKEKDKKSEFTVDDENRFLREDVRRAVVNYPEWHFADSGDVVVVDNLPPEQSAPLASSLTNKLPRLRKAYAAAAPSPLKDPLRPAIVRILDGRSQYLEYVGVEYQWTAAVWSPERRELVAYISDTGVDGLLKTVRHEAFHQYLAYAGCMITAAPWFNEGHAVLFENTHFDLDGEVAFDVDPNAAAIVRTGVKDFAEMLPAIMRMGYEEFYSGSDEDREAKYAIAWSIAYFLQKGAPELRFQPYKNLRADYMKALVRTRNMHEATRAVLPEEKMKEFVDDWLRFWSKDH